MADSPVRTIGNAPVIRIPREICRDFEHSSRLEWLEANHTGGFAMGTVAGLNTRRYHGLLIAALDPPAARYSIFPRVEETVSAPEGEWNLGAAQYPGVVTPRGFDTLSEFRLDPFPIWRHELAALAVERELCLLDRRQAVLLRYRSNAPCRIRVRVFLSFRDYHALTRRNDSLDGAFEAAPGVVDFHPYGDLPDLRMFHNAKSFTGDANWFLNHEYLRELDRGLDFREDLFSPGVFEAELSPEHPLWLLASVERDLTAPSNAADMQRLLEHERKRRQFDAPNPLEARLRRALDQFAVECADGRQTLVAGYPWFEDWGRDTMISLPAFVEADVPAVSVPAILKSFLARLSGGLLPNRFSSHGGAPEYNTADAALGFFVAAHAWLERHPDHDFLRSDLYPAASEILQAHIAGTKFGIHVDAADGLLAAGAEGVQLTWMDAVVDGRVVTPRSGKPVEINALWYNALRIAAQWARSLRKPEQAMEWEAHADRALTSFRAKFWNAARNCLFDVLGTEGPDAALRPNQLFALSLPFALLEGAQAEAVLGTVEEYLLTPVGLRTLAAEEPGYRGRYQGGPAERDSAYHQGTVWPWLLGPLVRAALRVRGDSASTRAHCAAILAALDAELTRCCLGSLCEIYDGDPPRRAAGCPAQLWSVAEAYAALRRLTSRPAS